MNAEGIQKRFGGVVALDGLDLDVKPGSIVALIGPNGSGKTTALRILSGTLTPDAGRLELDGRALDGGGMAARVDLGVVRTLQRTAVFGEMTAADNVLVGAGVRRRYGGAIRTVFATPKARAESREQRARASGILAMVGLQNASRTAASLTASEQRRLMLAAALATQPRVLLLDEISAGGTAEDVRELAVILERLRRAGLAIVLVEHNLRLVRDVASSVVVLAGGRTIAAGTPNQVAELPQVQAAYLGTHRL